MESNASRTDEANAIISATIKANVIEENLNKLAKEASKSMDIQGFRKGKVPLSIVKSRFSDKLKEDAESDALREVMSKALNDLGIENNDIIGEPSVTKFDKEENGDINIEIEISIKPNVYLADYKALLPTIEEKSVTDEEVTERINAIASQDASFTTLETPRAVQSGDFAVIDFEGFKDGIAFDGGKADGHTLEIGSNSFIPGFEDEIIGMKFILRIF